MSEGAVDAMGKGLGLHAQSREPGVQLANATGILPGGVEGLAPIAGRAIPPLLGGLGRLLIPGLAGLPQAGAFIGGMLIPGNIGQKIQDQITGPHAAPSYTESRRAPPTGPASPPPPPPAPDNGENPEAGDEPASDSPDIAEQAKRLGYDRPVKDPGFNSHGQKVFTNGKDFITPDVDAHKGGAWKKFDRQHKRLGTYDAKLNKIGE